MTLFSNRTADSVPLVLNQVLHEKIFPDFHFYLSSSPLLILLGGALCLILLGSFQKNHLLPHKLNVFFAAFLCFLSALFSLLFFTQTPSNFLGGAFLVDELSQKSFFVISLGTLLTILCSYTTEIGKKLLRYEMLALLLLSSSGMMIVVSSGEFASFFIGIELLSISLYVMISYQRLQKEGLEAGVKYFINGAAGSAILLFGAALIYSCLGSLQFSSFHLLQLSWKSPFSAMGLFFFFIGLFFKLAVAPFHVWAADVYEGANSHLTGYMAAFVKFTVVVFFIRLLSIHYSFNSQNHFIVFFSFLAICSMVIGALYGLVHNSVKRILAYSSIANAGYFTVGFVTLISNPGNELARQALFSYAIIYAVFSFSAFQLLGWFEEGNHENLLKEELFGLGSKKPLAGVAFSIVLFGFAGIPPFAGFIGKYFILTSALSQGFYGLVVTLIVLSSVSLYYYLSLCSDIWFRSPNRYSFKNNQSAKTNFSMNTILFCLILIMVIVGIFGPRFAYHI